MWALKNLLSRPKTDVQAPSGAELRDLAHRCSLALASQGRNVLATRDAAAPLFESATPARRRRIHDHFSPYVETLEAMIAAGENTKDSRQHVWRMLARLGLTPQPDVLDLIQDEDVVEIYDLDHHQIFRNLRFFDFISMSVEELLTQKWTDLTHRDMRVTLKALAQAMMIYTGQMRKTFDMSDWPLHVVTEKVGNRNRFELRLKYGSPIRRAGAPAGYLVTHSCRML